MAFKQAVLQQDGIERQSSIWAQRGDYFFAWIAVAVVIATFALWNEAVAHWFLLPLAACGVLAGVDVVRWLRGRMDTYDPRTVVACLAFYGCFVTPLLHVVWDTFGAGYDLILRGDWRPWLGAIATLQAIGFILFRSAHNLVYARARADSTRWVADDRKFLPVFGAAITVALSAQAYLLTQMGGIAGVIEAFERNKAAFEGKGWLLVFAGPLTVLSFIVLMERAKHQDPGRRSRWLKVVLLLSAVGIVHFVLMGWRGSRAATVLTVLWLIGIVHYRFRRIPLKAVAAGMSLLVGFMYFYGFYKERGQEGWEVLRSPSLWAEPQGYKRNLKGLLLGDLARADVTAFVLYNLEKFPRDYQFRYGLTYAGAFGILIPKNLWPDRPQFKIEAGTEAQYGKASRWRSSRVYGLSGEALLNFGPLGVPVMFGVFGALLGWYRRKSSGWKPSDLRVFLMPLAAMLFAAGFIGDSDNVVFAALTHGALVFAAVLMASNRQSEVSQP